MLLDVTEVFDPDYHGFDPAIPLIMFMTKELFTASNRV